MSRTFNTLYGLFWAVVAFFGLGPNTGLVVSATCVISIVLMHAGVLKDLNRSAYAIVATLVAVYTIVVVAGVYDLTILPLPTWMWWTTSAVVGSAALMLSVIAIYGTCVVLRLADADKIWAAMKAAIEMDKPIKDYIDEVTR